MLRVLFILSALSVVLCKSPITVAYYDEIKDLPNHFCEKLLVDVRKPSELKRTGRLPLSINVPLPDVEETFSNETSDEEFMEVHNRVKPKFMDQIIVYSHSGRRAQIAAETLVNLGYMRVKNYKGSWMEWTEKQLFTKINPRG